MSNTLDGTLVSPFSNITLARFGIPWEVKVELDSEGIQEFTTVFTTSTVRFKVTSDLPTEGTILYEIIFKNGVVQTEVWNFAPFGPSDSSEFKMNGSYDPATSTFAFQAPGGTLIESGAKFWLSVRVGGGQFPSVSDIDAFNNVQYPFQFTLAGATNGHQKTSHLFEKPVKDLTIKMPYFKRTGVRISEKNTVESGWVTDSGSDGVIGLRVSDTLRASQPFEMLSKWQFGVPFAGTVTTQSDTPESLLTWGLITAVFIAEHPQCSNGADPPFELPPETQTAPITYGDVSPPTDSGDGLRVTFAATPASQTIHRVQTLLSSATEGSGTAACGALTTPPRGDILATDAYRARNRNLVPPKANDWGFDRWKEQ